MPYLAKMRTQCAGGRVTPAAGTLSFISPHTKHNESWRQYIAHICKRMSKRVAIDNAVACRSATLLGREDAIEDLTN